MRIRMILPAALLLLHQLAPAAQAGWEISVSVEPAEITFLGTLPVEKVWVEGKPIELGPARENPAASENQLVIADQRSDLNSFRGRQFYVRYAIPAGSREIRFTLVDANKQEREGVISLPVVSAAPLGGAPVPMVGDPRSDAPSVFAVALTLPPGHQVLDRFFRPMPGDRPIVQVAARQGHAEYPLLLQTPEGLSLHYRLVADLKLPEGLSWPEASAAEPAASRISEGTLESGSSPGIRHPKRLVWTGVVLGLATATAAGITYYNARVQSEMADRSDDPARKRELRDRIKVENTTALGLSALSGLSFGFAATIAYAW